MSMEFSSNNKEKTDSNEPQVLSVSDLNKAVRGQLENHFKLIWVKGEISNFTAHSSGHHYFSLKDDKAQVSAVMFRGFNQSLKFRPESGMEVLVRGKITVYEPRGTFQIFCEQMEPVGAGALQLAFEQLKAKLQAEGLFEASRKRALPTLPKHVAVVTSPTGAAIRDILNVLERRFKGLRVTVIPALVQGNGAPASVIEGIRRAQKLKDVDVMIVGRGGGSIEDLWGFNDEGVARAIANCRIPVISAVGHEVDFTIADFVADLRAPTPSAAAELVCRNAMELMEKIQTLKAGLWRIWNHTFSNKKLAVQHMSERLVDPKRRLQDLMLRCDEMTQRLDRAWQRRLERWSNQVRVALSKLPPPRERILRLHQQVRIHLSEMEAEMRRQIEMRNSRLARLASVLDSISPLRVMERGFSIVKKDGQVAKDASKLKSKDQIEILLSKGLVVAEVLKVEKENNLKILK
ncbi:exodeoxyribonuclease VII large subunit [bacterium]|nr:exodeoxyribonuclease VII large subunit [bacterium]